MKFSSATAYMRSSEIRRLMQLAADPKIISFAGGMPNNSLFPTDLIKDLWGGLPVSIKQDAFQYGPTPGYPRLIEAVKEYLASKQIPIDNNMLIITTGAQQAINLTAKVLLDPGDTVVTEDPCFIGAVAAFKSYGANLSGVELDDDGIVMEKLDAVWQGLKKPPQLVYVSPYFHNPAGIIYSEERKKALLAFISDKDVCMLEDDPYGELYFNEADRDLTVPMKAMADKNVPICYTGSFAKIFGPGMRLGWLLGPAGIVEKCELAKQSMDACSATFTQVLAWAFLSQGRLKPYVESLRIAYKRRAGMMLEALEKYMPEGVRWTRPKGGFYLWVTLPENMDSTDVFNASIKKGAAFVIGSAFDPQGARNNSFRLAFSHTAEDRIEEGVKIIAGAVKDNLK
jgi:2-aminoadipate transaminase